MSDFEKEIKREKFWTLVVWGAIFAYLIWDTKDSDIGHAKLYWAVFGSAAFIWYKLYRLEELMYKIYTSVNNQN